MTYLSADELADFWALGISLEAEYVPDDEWQRALATLRVQSVHSYSSMGTAETGWVRATSPKTTRGGCAVVPPNQIAEDTPWGDLADDRDTIAVCWQWFWDQQGSAAIRHITEDKRAAFLEECARVLVELEQQWPEDRDDPQRLLLVDWLIAANKLAPDKLEHELSQITSERLRHLVNGVRARWLTRDVHVAYDAVLVSAERGKRDFWGHGNTEHQRVVRMALLRFVVRLVRRG